MPAPLPVLDAEATLRALGFAPLLRALRTAALDLADGRIICPERQLVPMADGALLLSMPAAAQDIASHKLITVSPGNPQRGLPAIQGHVSVLDSNSGTPLLMLDGPTVTGRRTAGISLLAIATFCQQPPAHVLVIGTGVQALHHVDALAALRPQALVSVRGTSPSKAQAFCAQYRAQYWAQHGAVPAALAPEEDADADSADVVITCTSSRAPIYTKPARAGRLVIAVGAFRPDSAEIAAATVLGSRVFVDDPAGARHEAGDLLLAGVDWNAVLPLAHALRHGVPADGRPILFKSVGCAAWDLAAARVALQHTQAQQS